MPNSLDLTGRRYGRLVVLRRGQPSGSRRLRARWICICDCGTEKSILMDALQGQHARSCGCLDMETKTSHGMSRTPEYKVWRAMQDRCTNPNNQSWDRYGGRGITVCDAWKDFTSFIADMGIRPSPGHSIDRIDGNGNYEPDNCRWATIHEQNNNREGNVLLTWKGETMTLVQWGRRLGICKETMRGRLRLGWTMERVVSTPVRAS